MSSGADDAASLKPALVLCIEVLSAAFDQTRRDESTPTLSPIEYRDRLRDLVESRGGTVLDSGLDGLYASLADAKHLASLVADLLATVTETRLRIGVHLGPAHCAPPVYGEAALVASAIARLARPEQALCSEAVVLAMPQDLSWLAQRVHAVELPGLGGRLPLYRIVPPRPDGDAENVGQDAEEAGYETLELIHGTEVYVCDESTPTLTLGRITGNDVVVRSDFTSRHHARIDKRGGTFVLKDMSANGTLVVDDQGRPVTLRGDTASLSSGGVLCLGSTVEKNPDGVLRFRCV